MAEIEETLLKKKLDNYSSQLEDFQAENELLVEITLNEYRELVKEKALKDYKIKEAENERYAKYKENEKLKEEIKELKEKILEYKLHCGELNKIEILPCNYNKEES